MFYHSRLIVIRKRKMLELMWNYYVKVFGKLFYTLSSLQGQRGQSPNFANISFSLKHDIVHNIIYIIVCVCMSDLKKLANSTKVICIKKKEEKKEYLDMFQKVIRQKKGNIFHFHKIQVIVRHFITLWQYCSQNHRK